MSKDIVIEAIQDGEIKLAIELFKELDLSSSQRSTLSIIESEFNVLSSDILKGVISDEQIQLRFNRINDKLLNLLQSKTEPPVKKRSRLLFLVVIVALVIIASATYFYSTKSTLACPDFDVSANNKILLVPFQNVSNSPAKPHVLLLDRIEQLVLENNLSTTIELADGLKNVTTSKAPFLAESCSANVIIWGKYSNASDSLSLILQYHFLDQPDFPATSELSILKDVTAIHSGTVTKNLEDAILLLCSVIALRQNKTVLAKKWLGEINGADRTVQRLKEALKKVDGAS